LKIFLTINRKSN